MATNKKGLSPNEPRTIIVHRSADIVELKKEIENLKQNFEVFTKTDARNEVKMNQKGSTKSIPTDFDDEDTFPIKTVKELNEFEMMLKKEKEFRHKMVNKNFQH